MSSIMTRWSVVQEHVVAPPDLDAGGAVSNRAVQRWIDHARAAYLAQCRVLEEIRNRSGLALVDRGGAHPDGAALGMAAAVVVTASATEVRPTSFVISVRIRPVRGDGDEPLDVRCVMVLEDPDGDAQAIGDAVRDELIALEHAARHFN